MVYSIIFRDMIMHYFYQTLTMHGYTVFKINIKLGLRWRIFCWHISLKQEKGEENNALVIEKNDNKNTQTIWIFINL